jgi:hypothetical protein
VPLEADGGARRPGVSEGKAGRVLPLLEVRGSGTHPFTRSDFQRRKSTGEFVHWRWSVSPVSVSKPMTKVSFPRSSTPTISFACFTVAMRFKSAGSRIKGRAYRMNSVCLVKPRDLPFRVA